MKEAAKRLAKRAQDVLVAAAKGRHFSPSEVKEELTDQEVQQVDEIKGQINQAYGVSNYAAINELISNDGNIYKKIALDNLKSYAAELIKIDGEKVLALNNVDKFHEFLQKNPILGNNISDDQGAGIASQALSFAIKNYQDHPEILHNVIELIKEQNPDNPEVLNQLSSRLVQTIQNFESVESAIKLDEAIKNLGADLGGYTLGSIPNKLLIKNQITQACEQNKFANVNSIITEAKKNCSSKDFIECKLHAEKLIQKKGEAILAKEKLADFKASDILTTEKRNILARTAGTDFLDLAGKLLTEQGKYQGEYDTDEAIPTTAVALEKVYKDAKEKIPNSKELDDVYISVKAGLTRLETIDPNAALTKADLVVLGLISIDLEFHKAKEFAEFLQKKPLLGSDLFDDTAGIGSQALNFAVENFRSSAQKFSSQPEMLHQVIELVKEQNRNNPKVLNQLAQELVKVSNHTTWPLSVLDLDLEIKKLEKLGVKVENYNFASLPESDQKHFLNMAHIICKADSNPNIIGKEDNIINLSAENLPTEAEMISVHKSIQALKTKIGQMPASAFLIGSFKEITEAYIKTQINNHDDFRKAINVMEIAQDSPSHRLPGDREEGVNELRDFTIKEITKAGEPILENPTGDTPKHFLDFLQRSPLFSSKLDDTFTEKTLQFGIIMAIEKPEILDKTIELFKEQYQDNDEVLEKLTNKLIEHSNLLTKNPDSQKTLNKKIIEHLGEFLCIDHIDINKIIAQASDAKNSSLVSALILNNSSADIEPNLVALKLMHDTNDPAAEKLLQRPEEAISYLASSDSIDDTLFNLILSKIPNKLDNTAIQILFNCSNSIKSSERRNELNQRIEKNISNFITDANDNDFTKSIQNTIGFKNPQLLNILILHSNGRKIINTPSVIESLQLLHKTGYLSAVEKMLEDPEQALLLIKESMNKLTRDFNLVSDELLAIIVTQLITSPKFNTNMADQLVESIDKADPAQKRVIYDTIQKNSAKFLVVAENVQNLIDKTLKDKEVDLLSEIIKHVSLAEIKVDLEALKLLHNKEQTTAVEKLLQHPDRATTYLTNANNIDIDSTLFQKIIKGVTKKIDQQIDYETRDVDPPSVALINCSNKAKNPAQRKAINAEIAAFIPENPKGSSEDEDFVNEATTAKNGELLSILIAKNIIWSKDVTLKTLEALHDGEYKVAIDKLLEDKELAAGLLFEAAKAKEFNQELVDILIPKAIKDENLGKPLLDALLPKITNAEQLNQIIDSQKDKKIALEAAAKDTVTIGLLSPKNTTVLIGVMLDNGINSIKNSKFSEVLSKAMEETYNNTKADSRPLSLKLAEKIYPGNPEKLTANQNYSRAVSDYEKKVTSFEKQPLLTKMRAFFARGRSKKAIEELEGTDVMTRMKGFFARKDSAAKYKTMKVNEKLSAIKNAFIEICSTTQEPNQKLSQAEIQQAAKKIITPIELMVVEAEELTKPKPSQSSNLQELSDLSEDQKVKATKVATQIIDAEREPASKSLTHSTSRRQIKPMIEH